MCDADEVAVNFAWFVSLLFFLCAGGAMDIVVIVKLILALRSRRKQQAAKKYIKEENASQALSPKSKSMQSKTRTSTDDGEASEANTNIALKRLLFQKMNRGYVDDDDGYVEEGNSVRRSTVAPGREPWEIDVKKIKFDKRIGAGNFGEVWVGTWMHSKVAIKTVIRGMSKRQEFVDKFVEEIKLMSELQHPNVVMFLGASIQPPHICLVLEYCVHGNLVEFLQSAREKDIAITMHLILKIALDIARGIKYLHDKMQIIQRDIKGRNVLIDENLNGKISDFGLSRIKKDTDAGLTACGTPAWTAPEVVRMEEYTEKVDVYSFAVVLWELITQSEPYDGEGGIQIAYAAAEQGLRPPIPEFTPERYSKLMVQCWADSPDDRPPFSEILERLFQMMKDESDPCKAAEFYFGTKRQNYDIVDIERLLDDNELYKGMFQEDYTAIVQERKELLKKELLRSQSHDSRRATDDCNGFVSLQHHAPNNKATIMQTLLPLRLRQTMADAEMEDLDKGESFKTRRESVAVVQPPPSLEPGMSRRFSL